VETGSRQENAWCFAAIAIKRLHDRNKSGWWMVLFFFCLRGTRGPNRFGSDPLARGSMRIDTASHAQA
jgi:uncharacterized membrane protein YhaH (DUF805 family)